MFMTSSWDVVLVFVQGCQGDRYSRRCDVEQLLGPWYMNYGLSWVLPPGTQHCTGLAPTLRTSGCIDDAKFFDELVTMLNATTRNPALHRSITLRCTRQPCLIWGGGVSSIAVSYRRHVIGDWLAGYQVTQCAV